MPQTRAETARTFVQEFFFDEIPVLCLQMDRPALPPALTPSAERRMARYYRRMERCCLSLCRKRLLPQASEAFRHALAESRPFSPLRLELRATVTRPGPAFCSLYWDLDLTGSGTEDGKPIRFADNWDLGTGYPARLSDLFPPDYNYRKRLPEAAANTCNPAGSKRDPGCKRFRRAFSDRNFYLGADRLFYFFPPTADSPTGVGVSVFSVPFPPPDEPA